MEVSRDAILNIGTVIEEEQRSSLTFGSCDASGSTNTLRMELGDAIMSGCGSVQGLPFSGSTAAFDALLMAVDLVHQEEEELERRMESDTKPSTLSQVLSGWQVPIVEGVQQDIVSSNAVPLIQSSSVVNMEMEFTIPDWPKVVTPDID